MKLLTKSNFALGLSCVRCMWIAKNRPEEVAEPSASDLARMEQGILVGKTAQGLFPSGVNAQRDDFKEGITASKKLLSCTSPIFEGAFMAKGCYSRADILEHKEGKW